MEKNKTSEKSTVGAVALKSARKENGITLVALIITIIVMLILVGVSIQVVINSNLIGTAQDAANRTETAYEEEGSMSEIKVGNDTYGSIDAYLKLSNAPNVNLNGYTSGKWTNQDITINLTGAQTGTTYQYSNDNGTTWQDCESTITINEDQNKEYIFRMKDAEDSVSPATQVYNIKRDTVDPIVAIIPTATGDRYIEVTVINEDDTGSNIVSYSYAIKQASASDDDYVTQYKGENSSYTITGLTAVESYTIKVTVVDEAGNGNEVFTTAGTTCFVAGTQVLTETGMRNIEDIAIGDKVWTINLDNNQRELKEVTKLFIGESNEIYEITINEEVIEATPKHQFYIVDKGWIRAYELEEGDQLIAKDNEKLVINKIVHKKDITPVKVYNLTVEGNHNYLITKYEVLVHNAASVAP